MRQRGFCDKNAGRQVPAQTLPLPPVLKSEQASGYTRCTPWELLILRRPQSGPLVGWPGEFLGGVQKVVMRGTTHLPLVRIRLYSEPKGESYELSARVLYRVKGRQVVFRRGRRLDRRSGNISCELDHTGKKRRRQAYAHRQGLGEWAGTTGEGYEATHLVV